MAWTVSAAPDAFTEAVLWFLLREPMTRAQWDLLTAQAKRQAFMVSNVAKADVIHDVFRAIDRALANGTGFAAFKKDVGAKLLEAWGGSVKNPAWRLETIYRTNTQNAYSAGRWKQMSEPGLKRLRPFAKFDAVMDNRTSAICEPLDGVVMELDEWQKAGLNPPLHFSCRSSLRSLRASQAERESKRTLPDGIAAQDGFGATPSESEWEPDLDRYPPELRDEVASRLKETPESEPIDPPEGATFID